MGLECFGIHGAVGLLGLLCFLYLLSMYFWEVSRIKGYYSFSRIEQGVSIPHLHAGNSTSLKIQLTGNNYLLDILSNSPAQSPRSTESPSCVPLQYPALPSVTVLGCDALIADVEVCFPSRLCSSPKVIIELSVKLEDKIFVEASSPHLPILWLVVV